MMERKIIEHEVKRARKRTLDLIETAYGATSNWPFIRSQILNIFGKNGLESVLLSSSDYQERKHGYKKEQSYKTIY